MDQTIETGAPPTRQILPITDKPKINFSTILYYKLISHVMLEIKHIHNRGVQFATHIINMKSK